MNSSSKKIASKNDSFDEYDGRSLLEKVKRNNNALSKILKQQVLLARLCLDEKKKQSDLLCEINRADKLKDG